MFSTLSKMLPRDESTEAKFKQLLTETTLGATVRSLTPASALPG
jgi:hypothetical protein